MSIHLITGKAGYEHVKAADHAALHAAIMGGGEFVLEGGEQFACQVISNNKVRIFDGEAMMQGRHIRIDRNTYEETTHENGAQGYKRIDLIVLTYTMSELTGVETVTLDVIKGTPAENNPSVPEYVTGDILNNGEQKNQMPLYQIPFDGLSIGEPVKLFSTVPTLETMKKEVDAEVDAKKEELDEKFKSMIVSNVDDMALIENYGEYVADAKTVGELNKKIIVKAYNQLPDVAVTPNSQGKLEVAIPDASGYRANGYIGYVLSAFLFSTLIISNPLSVNVTSSGGTISIAYIHNGTTTTAPPRAVIAWIKNN